MPPKHNPFPAYIGVLLALSLAACTSLPSTPSPSVEVPATWQTPLSEPAGVAMQARWWAEFNTPELSALIDQALLANRDLRIAAARVAQARAAIGVTDSDRMPQLAAGAGANKGRETVLDPKTTVLRAGVQASWEADIYGAKGLASRAAQLDAQSAELARQGMETVIAAEVATAYLDAAVLKQREALGQQRLELLAQAVSTTEKQFAAGRAIRLDMDRRIATRQAYASDLAQLQSARQQRLLQLSTLLGAAPGSVQPAFTDVEKIQIPLPQAGLPGELLERRPDVQQQARAVSAAAARVGVAKRDLYPRLIFSWAGAHERARIDGQETVNNVAIGYGVSITLPILDGGRIRSNIRVNEARLQEAMASYEKAMIEALGNAETVLVRQNAAAESLKQLRDAAETSARAQSNAQKLFEAGLSDKTGVLDAQDAVMQAQDARLQAQSAYWTASVDVYRAFAGSTSARVED